MTLVLSISLAVPAGAAYTGAAIQLTETSGTVTVSKSNGKTVSIRANMRLYNGYNVTTEAESYAWINLDSSKLIKVDASSSVELRKNGNLLEVNVSSGSVYFEVSQKLSNNETAISKRHGPSPPSWTAGRCPTRTIRWSACSVPRTPRQSTAIPPST